MAVAPRAVLNAFIDGEMPRISRCSKHGYGRIAFILFEYSLVLVRLQVKPCATGRRDRLGLILYSVARSNARIGIVPVKSRLEACAPRLKREC